MKTFKEYVEDRDLQEIAVKAVNYKPGAIIPGVVFKASGPEKMNPLASVAPSKPYMPIFRAGKKPSGIMGR